MQSPATAHSTAPRSILAERTEGLPLARGGYHPFLQKKQCSVLDKLKGSTFHGELNLSSPDPKMRASQECAQPPSYLTLCTAPRCNRVVSSQHTRSAPAAMSGAMRTLYARMRCKLGCSKPGARPQRQNFLRPPTHTLLAATLGVKGPACHGLYTHNTLGHTGPPYHATVLLINLKKTQKSCVVMQRQNQRRRAGSKHRG